VAATLRTADAVVVVRPRDFGFNEETGADNTFQNRLDVPAAEINRRANIEFQNTADRLRAEGIEVLILEPGEGTNPPPPQTPDAVFPNNWFSTECDGTLVVYPMMAPNRRAERRIDDLQRLLRENGRRIENVVDLSAAENDGRILEGTGALVIDRAERIVYAARSQRCHPDLFDEYVQLRSYREGILFDTRGSSGNSIYHTNVVLAIGEKFAVICSDAVPEPAQRCRVLESLRRSFDVIEISMPQMEEHYCGNILEVRTRAGEPRIVMSARAERGFTAEQRRRLAAYGKIVSVDIDTIETVGGGSARCMLAEIFSPRVEEG
jgi:hypothetical protein